MSSGAIEPSIRNVHVTGWAGVGVSALGPPATLIIARGGDVVWRSADRADRAAWLVVIEPHPANRSQNFTGRVSGIEVRGSVPAGQRGVGVSQPSTSSTGTPVSRAFTGIAAWVDS